MIELYFCEFSRLKPHSFNDYLNLLPFEMQASILSFRNWEDQYARLFGRLLLRDGLNLQLNGNRDCWNLRYTKYKRPFILGQPDFNISHSGKVVGCAVASQTVRVGFDIECIRPVPFTVFQDVFHDTEWDDIYSSKEPLVEFYHKWTQKEAVVKASGEGLYLPFNEIQIVNGCCEVGHVKWRLFPVDLVPGYKSCIAADADNVSVQVTERFYNFSSL